MCLQNAKKKQKVPSAAEMIEQSLREASSETKEQDDKVTMEEARIKQAQEVFDYVEFGCKVWSDMRIYQFVIESRVGATLPFKLQAHITAVGQILAVGLALVNLSEVQHRLIAAISNKVRFLTM